MAQIFYKMFNSSPNTVINFLSNKSNILEDISIISKMPKWVFLKQLFKLNTTYYSITTFLLTVPDSFLT
mgnify:CR=1 FL=1